MPSLEQTKLNLKKTLAGGLEYALPLLEKTIAPESTRFNGLVIQQTRYHRVTHEKDKGVISNENAEKILAQISLALLHLIDELTAEDLNPSAFQSLFNKKEPSLDFHPIACDRNGEMYFWNQFFDEHKKSGKDLHFFFTGHGDDRPQSFVRRFLHEQEMDELRLDVDWVQHNGQTSDINCLAFPNRRDCEQRLANLKEERLKTNVGRFDFCVFFFEIEAKAFNQEALLGLKNWIEKRSPFEHPLLCFYWLKQPARRNDGRWSFFARRAPDPIKDFKSQLGERENCFWWDNVWSLVTMDDLKDWFKSFTDHFVEDIIEKWFQGRGELRMHPVEHELRELIKRETSFKS